MEKKTLTAELSVSSIRQLQKDLRKYQNELVAKCREFTRRVAQAGMEIAVLKIVDLKAIFTGELIESIHIEHKENTPKGTMFAVVTDAESAVFVEFGTGWKGINTPYPNALPEGVKWEYNTGDTIRYNPVKGTYYWFYPGDDGNWYYTEGMPSRPFMYLTAQELRNVKLLGEIAREVFGS